MNEEPEGFEKWNRALQGAFRKGYKARIDGVPADCCPYKDWRQDSGHLTWSRAFRSAWHDGWRWADNKTNLNNED